MSETTGNTSTAVDLSSVGAGRWAVDPAGSSVLLRHKTFWGLLTVKGGFGEVRGEGEVADDGTAHGSLALAAGSLDTKNRKRDEHLRSADLLDVENHPEIVFRATGAAAGAGADVDIVGTLTVRGITQPLNFTARATEAGPDAVTIAGDIEVDRADFGVTWNQLGMLTGRTAISLAVRFVRTTV